MANQSIIGQMLTRREPAVTPSGGAKAGTPAMGPFSGLAEEARTYLDAVGGKLEDVKEAVGMLHKNDRTIRIGDSTDSAAGGTVDVDLGIPKAGTSWEIERISTEVTGGGAPTLKIYLDDVNDPIQKIESIGNPTDYSDAANNNIYVPPNRRVIARFASVAAGGRVAIALQIKERTLASRTKARLP